MERRSIGILILACGWLAWPVPSGAEAQDRTVAGPPPAESLKTFRSSADREARRAAFERLVGLDAGMVTKLKALVDQALAEEEKGYAALLSPRIREAHLERLGALSEDQVRKVQATRRLWKNYLLHGGDLEKFQERYLKPVHEIGAFLLFDVESLKDPEIQSRRARMEEYSDYQVRCAKVLKQDLDPTAGKKSPNGIAFPALTQAPSFKDRMRHLERTLVLCQTVASPGARPVLMMNDEAAREIDVQEAEFTMYCNEARMLTGTIAWRVETLGSAVERDHSTDRKEGRAQGHMSDVPGKRGFTDRNTRMAAPFYDSEGAGGGSSGRNYAEGLSYGGGHTGPLYSLKRNCVGIGRRADVYTSQYRFDESLTHPCPVTEDELWMPPGITAQDLGTEALRAAYRAMKAGAFSAVIPMMERLKPKNGLEKAVAAFFRVAAEVEADWFASSIAEIEKTGDLYEAKLRLLDGQRRFKGIGRFEERIAGIPERLEVKDELAAGKIFHQIVAMPLKESEEASRVQALRQFSKRHEQSVYAKAVAAALKDPKAEAPSWFAHFVAQNPGAKSYGYPPAAVAAPGRR